MKAETPKVRPHFANGRECRCRMKWSDNPTEYVREHPNKRGDDGQTFNDAIEAARLGLFG